MKSRLFLIIRDCLVLLIVSIFSAGSITLASDTYPSQIIKLVVGYGAGGSADTSARVLAKYFGEYIGEKVIVVNREGAASVTATSEVARTEPDGYTLMQTHNANMGALPAFKDDLPYNYKKDYASIGLYATQPNVLFCRSDAPWKNLTDLLSYLKTHPDTTYASGPVASSNFMAGELFKLKAGLSIVNVPLKNAPDAIAAVLGGHMPLGSINYASLKSFIADGSCRVLALSSPWPMKELPGVKTFEEYGYKGCYVMSWHGLSAPVRVPAPILTKIRTAFAKTCEDPNFVKDLYKVGYFVKYLDAEQYSSFIELEIKKFRKMRDDGIKVNK